MSFHSKSLKDSAPNVLFDYYSAWLIDVDRFILQPLRLIASLTTEAANRRRSDNVSNINHQEHCIMSCIKSIASTVASRVAPRVASTVASRVPIPGRSRQSRGETGEQVFKLLHFIFSPLSHLQITALRTYTLEGGRNMENGEWRMENGEWKMHVRTGCSDTFASALICRLMIL